MDMFSDFFAGLYDELESLMRDDRTDAEKAFDAIEYSDYKAVRRSLTEAELVYDDAEYDAWDVRCDLEPAWTDAEEAFDVIDMNSYDAEIMSDAASAWNNVRFDSNK